MAFYVGQKVARHKGPGHPHSGGIGESKVPIGKPVTISWIGYIPWYNATVIDLIEFPFEKEPGYYFGYDALAFRPLTSRPTSISIFTDMLGPTKVREDA